MKTNIEKWLHHTFESSSQTTPEFKSFANTYKKVIQDLIGDNFELVDFNRGHFYCSGFIQHKPTSKYIYFSCSDVRFFPNEWNTHLLIRTAKNTEDYSGGANKYTSLCMLLTDIDSLVRN